MILLLLEKLLLSLILADSQHYSQFLYFFFFFAQYRINPKYWDRQAWANSVDPDQTLLSVASDLGRMFALAYLSNI